MFARGVQSGGVKEDVPVPDPVTKKKLINRTVVLPKKARLLLCGTCLTALQQERVAS